MARMPLMIPLLILFFLLACQFGNAQVSNCTACPDVVSYYHSPSQPVCESAFVPSCCPVGFQNCTCRPIISSFVVNVNFTNTIRFCQGNSSPCCKQCSCTGDPHCISFAGQAKEWVVCDVRNSQCQFFYGNARANCAKATYLGQQCQMRRDPSGKLFCQYPLAAPQPQMNMYSKTYRSQSDGKMYQFRIELILSVFGSTSVIQIWDKVPTTVKLPDNNPTYTFSLTFATKKKRRITYCNYPSVYSSQIMTSPSEDILYIDNLDSAVQLQLNCNRRKSAWGTNWDVYSLEDPLFNPAQSGGFCYLGYIAEMGIDMNRTSACVTVDQELFAGYFKRYVGYGKRTCNNRSPLFLDECKTTWCSKPLQYLYPGEPAIPNWKAAGFSSINQCVQFTTTGDPQNFLRTICAVSPAVRFISSPALCDSIEVCRVCMQNVMDYPADVQQTLGKPAATKSPTVPCNINAFIADGLALKALPANVGGLEIQRGDLITNQWTSVFAATDSSINQQTQSCGCFEVDFPAQLGTGLYRMNQCFSNPPQDPCVGSPEYNITLSCGPPYATTFSPTKSPTASPNTNPKSPTSSPSRAPTSSIPTFSPSFAPTSSPTVCYDPNLGLSFCKNTPNTCNNNPNCVCSANHCVQNLAIPSCPLNLLPCCNAGDTQCINAFQQAKVGYEVCTGDELCLPSCCSGSYAATCQIPCNSTWGPTVSPSLSPITEKPSIAPSTSKPSFSPSHAPSHAPTLICNDPNKLYHPCTLTSNPCFGDSKCTCSAGQCVVNLYEQGCPTGLLPCCAPTDTTCINTYTSYGVNFEVCVNGTLCLPTCCSSLYESTCQAPCNTTIVSPQPTTLQPTSHAPTASPSFGTCIDKNAQFVMNNTCLFNTTSCGPTSKNCTCSIGNCVVPFSNCNDAGPNECCPDYETSCQGLGLNSTCPFGFICTPTCCSEIYSFACQPACY